MYPLIFLLLICSSVGIVYFILKNRQRFEEDVEVPIVNNQILSPDNRKLQLQTLISARRVTACSMSETANSKKMSREEDGITLLHKIESRIADGLRILDGLTDDKTDFNLILASSKLAKLKIFGTKFLKVVQGRAAKAAELKKAGSLADEEINKFIVRPFTVEMNVMNDLLDRNNYVAAISWKDLTAMVESFESDILEVSKLFKSHKQGLSSTS